MLHAKPAVCGSIRAHSACGRRQVFHLWPGNGHNSCQHVRPVGRAPKTGQRQDRGNQDQRDGKFHGSLQRHGAGADLLGASPGCERHGSFARKGGSEAHPPAEKPTSSKVHTLEEFISQAGWQLSDFTSAASGVELENTNFAGPSKMYTRLLVTGGGGDCFSKPTI